MWLQSIAKDETKVLLNHGQHVDIPGLIKGKTNRVFAGLFFKNQAVTYCRLDSASLEKLIEKIKVIRVNAKNAPKYLNLPEEPQLNPSIKISRIG